MKIRSGTTDQTISFVAVDATDLQTRETGLSSFTVYRSRNGAAPVALTTPTIPELSSSNMPGVYALLLDEDMTIGAGNFSEDMVFHVSHAGMNTVTLGIELENSNNFDPANDTVATVTDVTNGATATDLATVDNIVDAIKVSTDNLPSDPADQSLIIAATDAITSAIGALNNLSAADILTTQLTESYAADGAVIGI